MCVRLSEDLHTHTGRMRFLRRTARRAMWTCLDASWSTRAGDAGAGAGDATTRDAVGDGAGAARAAVRSVGAMIPRDVLERCATFGARGAASGDASDARARRAVRRVVRALGQGSDAKARAVVAAMADAANECAAKTVLPRRADEVIETLRAVARCGDDFSRAMVPGSGCALLDAMDGGKALMTARRNADVATAYFEALASALGVENERAMGLFRALATVNVFEHDDRPTVFGVMDVFQGLACSASAQSAVAVAAALEKSGALGDFIARAFVTMAAREDDADAIDVAMSRRFFAFVIFVLRARSERFQALAFAGVESAATPVVARLCLSRAGSEPNAAALYQEIKRRER